MFEQMRREYRSRKYRFVRAESSYIQAPADNEHESNKAKNTVENGKIGHEEEDCPNTTKNEQ